MTDVFNYWRTIASWKRLFPVGTTVQVKPNVVAAVPIQGWDGTGEVYDHDILQGICVRFAFSHGHINLWCMPSDLEEI